MSLSKVGVGVGVVAVAAAVVLGGSAIADAAARSTQAAGSTGYGGDNGGYGGYGGYGGGQGRGGAGAGGRGASNDTAVTGDELAKVTAAMKAEDAAVTVSQVRKDPDGSYDVLGTKAGAPVFYDVSADLGTFTAGGGRGGRGGHGGADHTPVSGSELTKVSDAVKAKNPAVTVQRVQKDPDGSYDVFGTKAGAQVRFEVSKDLATITQGTAGPRGGSAPSPNGSGPGA